jgi:hypothetical protein
MATNQQASRDQARPPEDRWLELVRQHVGSLDFGVVQIVVHNSRVTQIERTERRRLDLPRSESLSNPPENWR